MYIVSIGTRFDPFLFLYQHYFSCRHVAQALGYGFLNPYFRAFNSNFTCGANFATSGSKAVDDGTKLFPFPIQLTQFKYFLSQTIINETSNLDAGTPLYLSLYTYMCETSYNAQFIHS